MRIIEQSYELALPTSGEEILKTIEKVARICYKSEDKITNDSAAKLVSSLIARGHEAMLEHVGFTVKFVCDRGVSHELVRHRIASFAQESTRYVNYSNGKHGSEITVIEPFTRKSNPNAYDHWEWSCKCAEKAYMQMLAMGATPQDARSVLPNSLKTEIVVTANAREWRHLLKLRTAKEAHPMMRNIMTSLLTELKEKVPIIFDDI